MAFDVSGPQRQLKQQRQPKQRKEDRRQQPVSLSQAAPRQVPEVRSAPSVKSASQPNAESSSDPNNNPLSDNDLPSDTQANPTVQTQNQRAQQDPDARLEGILLSPEQLRQVQPDRQRSQRSRRVWLGAAGMIIFGVVLFASIRAMMQTTTTIDSLRNTSNASDDDGQSGDSATLTLDAFQQGLTDFSELTNPEATPKDTSVTARTAEELQRLYEAATPGSDADRDELTVEQEREHGTNPLNPDTDGDGYFDGEEVVAGFSPTEPSPLATRRTAYNDVDRHIEFTYPSSATLTAPVLINGSITSDDQSVPQIKVFEVRALFDGIEGIGQLPPETWQAARQVVEDSAVGERIDEQVIPAIPVYGTTVLGDATDVTWLGVVPMQTHRGVRAADGWVHFTDRDGSVVLARVTTFFSSAEHIVQFVSFYDTNAPEMLLAKLTSVMSSLDRFDHASIADLSAIDPFQEAALKEHERLVMSALIE